MKNLSNSTTALPLSQNSLAYLREHGYHSKLDDNHVSFKRNYDFIGPLILLFMFAMISLPLFDFNYWIGAALFISLILGVYMHYALLSGKTLIKIDRRNEFIDLENRFGRKTFTFKDAESVYTRTLYNDSIVGSNKCSSNRYKITVGVTLKNGNNLNLFHYRSEGPQPSREVLEVHEYVRSILRP